LQIPTPPPDATAADEEAAARTTQRDQQIADIRAWQDDLMNEISMLDYAVVRMELTTNSNQAERERYAVEKNAITSKQQHVRDNIEDLRGKLKDAKDLLAVRKTYDELTEKITNSKMLKPRDEQAAAHAKLDEEIAELQDEVESSKRTWTERRVQFGRIEEEAKEMLRMIKDEKEEAERKEGMMKDDGEEGEGSTTRGAASQVGTPRPDAGSGTPMHPGSGDEQSQSLRPPRGRLASMSNTNSGAPSPARSGVQDTEMADKGDDSSGMEEGEEEDEGEIDNMDES
jgi:predicted  nucleic acid-binding Zn-ribbon protein